MAAITTTSLFYVNYPSTFFRQTKIHNIGAKVVGVDQYGNKYYENLELQYG